jgi:hypothetical protein
MRKRNDVCDKVAREMFPREVAVILGVDVSEAKSTKDINELLLKEAGVKVYATIWDALRGTAIACKTTHEFVKMIVGPPKRSRMAIEADFANGGVSISTDAEKEASPRAISNLHAMHDFLLGLHTQGAEMIASCM